MQDIIAFAPEKSQLRFSKKQMRNKCSLLPTLYLLLFPLSQASWKAFIKAVVASDDHRIKTQYNDHQETKKLKGHLALIYTPNFTNEETEEQIKHEIILKISTKGKLR